MNRTGLWTAVTLALLACGTALAGALKTNVTVQNTSAWSIYQLHVSPTSESNWGPDQLGSDVIITGESYELTGVPCGSYDFKLVDEDGDVCVMNAVEVCSGSSTLVIDSDALLACQAGSATTASAGGSITIENQSAWAIYRFYLSPVTDSSWGDDHLGTEVISTGETFALNGVACTSYDVKIVDEDGDECVMNAVDICGDSNRWVIDSAALLACQAGTTTTPSGGGATITIENQSAWAIYQFYVSATTESTWGSDQLGTEVISTGESFDLGGIPCASYDVKLVDEDGDVCVMNAVDICGGSNSWVITSESLLACQAQ
ncbi:MAG: hypothetical protein JRJ84_15465 [Deltaproteobacteria bacterium]|nr:hypothetical protein [Deltaproteobacteria bacterium]